jgi:transposase
MAYGAIDLHKKESQIRIVTDSGEVLDRRIVTTRDRLTAMFWGRPPMRILLEAATESEWVAQHLETLGHEVIVADPNFTPMYGHRSRRVKTDRRDGAALAEACQRGFYRVAHRRSATQRTVQAQLNVRRELTDSRTRAISLARAIIGGAGFRMRSGSTKSFLDRVTALELPSSITETLAPLRAMIEVVTEELARADERFATLAAETPVVTRLMTLPGIGPITASAYVAALDDATRFGRAAQVASYLGLVPGEYSSGEQQRRGRVLRSAHPHVQSLLVQAAWRLSRSKDPRTAGLRVWAQGIAHRRGRKIAMVALARRLARILFALWRDGVAYDGARIRPTPRHVAAPLVQDATRLVVNRE